VKQRGLYERYASAVEGEAGEKRLEENDSITGELGLLEEKIKCRQLYPLIEVDRAILHSPSPPDALGPVPCGTGDTSGARASGWPRKRVMVSGLMKRTAKREAVSRARATAGCERSG
jgi:hypothetical protein